MKNIDAYGNNLIKCDIQSTDDIEEILEHMRLSIIEHIGEDSAEMRVLSAMYDAFEEAVG